MAGPLKALAPVLAMLAGLYLLRRAFEAHAGWRLMLAEGDPSAAELFEIELWLNLPPALILIAFGGVLAGRWWRR